MKTLDNRQTLYQIAYPFLWQRLDYLVTLVQAQDPNILSLVLYGSVARGTAYQYSDVDLLIFVEDEQLYSNSKHWGAHWLTMTEDYVPWPTLEIAWAFSPFVDQLDCHYMTEDLIANIQRDGILIYRRPAAELPAWTEHLQAYKTWREQMAMSIERAQPTSA